MLCLAVFEVPAADVPNDVALADTKKRGPVGPLPFIWFQPVSVDTLIPVPLAWIACQTILRRLDRPPVPNSIKLNQLILLVL